MPFKKLSLATVHTYRHFYFMSQTPVAPAAAQTLPADGKTLKLLAALLKWIDVTASSCHRSLLLLLLLLLLLVVRSSPHRQRVDERRQSDFVRPALLPRFFWHLLPWPIR
jgi:hypothetical protein